MRFKEFLTEFRPNKPQINPIDKDTLLSWVKDSELQKFWIGIPGEKDVVIFKYSEFGNKDIFFILTDRKDNSDIVGYMWLHNVKSDIWQVRDVTIFKPYQGKGIGTSIYVKLIKEHYKLINGYSLSNEAEKLWRGLSRYVKINTINIETEEITEFSELPRQDNKWDDEQKYFWIATYKDVRKLSECENRTEGVEHWYLKWLKGNTHTPGSFRTEVYGQENNEF